MSFANDIKKFAEKTKKEQTEIVKATLFQVNEFVIKSTPVDTGRARGSWIPSIGSMDRGTGGKDKSGNSTVNKANNVAESSIGSIYYLTNNLPYIGVLEYGGYPYPVEKGTWIKKSGRYEILSERGYSKQAPQGMVRIAVKAAMQQLRMGRNG